MRLSPIRSLLLSMGACLLLIPGVACVSEPKVDPDQGLEQTLKLPPDIRSVSSDGLWLHEGREGWLRFVVVGGGLEHYGARLYIQWFTQTGDGADATLVETVAVAELNQAVEDRGPPRALSFGAPRCEDRVPCSEAVLDVFDTRTTEEKRYRLHLDEGPGRYRLEGPSPLR